MPTPAASGMSFFVSAHDADEAGLGLFVQADEIPSASGGLTLTLRGVQAPASGAFGGATLYVGSDDSGNLRRRELPLFLRASAADAGLGNMNLWVRGAAREASLGFDLYAHNAQSGVSAGVTLVISGGGAQAEWLPFDKSMSLVLARNPAAAAPLYIGGPGDGFESGVPLFTSGLSSGASGVPMTVAGVVGFADESVRLYTHGW